MASEKMNLNENRSSGEISRDLSAAKADLKKLSDLKASHEKLIMSKAEKENLKIINKEYAYRLKKEKELLEALHEQKLKEISEVADVEKRLALIQEEEAEHRKRTGADKTLSKDASEALSQAFSGLASSLNQIVGGLKSTLENTMNSFLSTQSSMAYNLNGTERSLEGITDTLGKALGGTGLVKQQEVYKNLQDLVNEGIVYNVEQRAFLKTISDDFGMIFDPRAGSLPRLINLQRQDLSSNRMAIEASLKEFLNQNYETSQYIKDGFANVSNALLEAQSIMTARSGMDLEAVVQQWMGSLSSVGMSQSTIDALATAIGQLGSGNISALSGSNMQNLLVMGAARSGLSYAQLLTEGLSGSAADELIRGIVGYITEIGQSTSNVVKSEYARIFGLNVSDLVAASQVGNVTANGVITDDISNLLGKMDEYVYSTTQLDNFIANFMYDWATGIASNESEYLKYRMVDLISSTVSNIVSGLSFVGGAATKGISAVLSPILNAAPLISTLPTLIESIGNLGTNFQDTVSNVFGEALGDEAGKIVNRKLDEYLNPDDYITVRSGSGMSFKRRNPNNRINSSRAAATRSPSILNTLSQEATGANRIFGLLGGGTPQEQYIRSTGNLTSFTKVSGTQTSGAMVIGNTNTSDIALAAKNSAMDYAAENLVNPEEEYYDATSIYKLLSADPTGSEWSFATDAHNLLTSIYGNGDLNLHSELSAINTTMSDSIYTMLGTIKDAILSLPTYEYNGTFGIRQDEQANTVRIGNDMSYISDVMTLNAMNVQNIYNLLFSYMIEGAGPYVGVSTEEINSKEGFGWAGPSITTTGSGL